MTKTITKSDLPTVAQLRTMVARFTAIKGSKASADKLEASVLAARIKAFAPHAWPAGKAA